MAQRPANPVPASLQGRQRDKDTTAVIYGGIDMYTDEHGFKTADAPANWPFGRLTLEQMAKRDRDEAAQTLRDAEPALM